MRETIIKFIFFGIFIFLSGCATIKIPNTEGLLLPNTVVISKNSKEFQHLFLENRNTKLKGFLITNQSDFKISSFCGSNFASERMNNSAVMKYVQQDLENISTMSQKNDSSGSTNMNQPFIINHNEIRELLEAFDEELKVNLLNANFHNEAFSRRTKNENPTFSDLLIDYIKAYVDGNFVLRNGTKLSKPSGSLKLKDGQINASTDNNTVIGLTTVLLEALFDSCYKTNVYFKNETIETYIPQYQVKHKKQYDLVHYVKDKKGNYKPDFEENNEVQYKLAFYKKETMTNPNYLLADEPTAAKYFNKELSESGVSEKELKVIRRVSDILSEVSKGVSGTLFKSLGGLGISFGGFAKASIGDNDSLNKIAETLVEVWVRKRTEWILENIFTKYKSGTDSDVDNFVNNMSL